MEATKRIVAIAAATMMTALLSCALPTAGDVQQAFGDDTASEHTINTSPDITDKLIDPRTLAVGVETATQEGADNMAAEVDAYQIEQTRAAETDVTADAGAYAADVQTASTPDGDADNSSTQAAVENAQAQSETPGAPEQSVQTDQTTAEPRSISVNGTSMGFVDSYRTATAPSSGAGLWMGSDSTTDGTWGYFIGHNPGSFTCVMALGTGDPVTICDSDGASRTYHVVKSFVVPDTTYWEDIEGDVTGYGESVILQTCCGDNATYRIVVAA